MRGKGRAMRGNAPAMRGNDRAMRGNAQAMGSNGQAMDAIAGNAGNPCQLSGNAGNPMPQWKRLFKSLYSAVELLDSKWTVLRAKDRFNDPEATAKDILCTFSINYSFTL